MCSEESEKVSELKSVSGTARLPYGTLALGAEGIKEAISGFDDAYVMTDVPHILSLTTFHLSRKSDIENERLPPDLYDPESEEGKGLISSLPQTPAEDSVPPVSPNGVTAALEQVIAGTTPINTSVPPSPASPASPTSPNSISPTPFRRGHGRQASLGTTMTSPSTRRRSLESTMSLIQEAWDGKSPLQDPELVKLADSIAEKSTGKDKTSESGRTSPSGGAAPS